MGEHFCMFVTCRELLHYPPLLRLISLCLTRRPQFMSGTFSRCCPCKVLAGCKCTMPWPQDKVCKGFVQDDDSGAYDYFPDGSHGMNAEFCAFTNNTKLCKVPTPMERNKANLGNLFLSSAEPVAALAVTYNRFLSHVVADAIVDLSATAKAVSSGKLLTMAVNGYLLTLTAPKATASGHLSLRTLLRSSLDAIVAPYDYEVMRLPYSPFFPSGPADSTRLWGKIWMTEDDTRGFPFAAAAERHQFGTINSTRQEGWVLQRNMWGSAAHGAGLCEPTTTTRCLDLSVSPVAMIHSLKCLRAGRCGRSVRLGVGGLVGAAQ